MQALTRELRDFRTTEETSVTYEAHMLWKIDDVQLEPLERFVFVMSILEGHTPQECSILLNCTKQDVAIAQVRALQQVALAEANRLTPVVPGDDAAHAAHFLEPVQAA